MQVDGKNNEFKLSGTETIKIGRVKLTIREINTSVDENKTDFDSFENNIQQEQMNIDSNIDQIVPGREVFQSFEN